MKCSGHLQKMRNTLSNPVDYHLLLDDHAEHLNPYIGKKISIDYAGAIHCTACGRKTNKSYSQGHCYPCFQKLPQCDMCIMKPETCHYDAGTCRDSNWGDDHCMQPHYVYLANSSGIKVGITRGTQIPTRWIDQGASQALPIFKVSHRKLSGLIEVALKDHVSDRTDWRKMLKGSPEAVDLIERRNELLALASKELDTLREQFGEQAMEVLTDAEIVSITFPVEQYPEKIKSLNLEKTPHVEGVLQGIKGQYLILDCGVINLRKYTGYDVTFSLNE